MHPFISGQFLKIAGKVGKESILTSLFAQVLAKDQQGHRNKPAQNPSKMVFVRGCGGMVSFFEDKEDCTVQRLRSQIEVRDSPHATLHCARGTFKAKLRSITILFACFQEATGIKTHQQRLVYGGTQLEPNARLSDYGLEAGMRRPSP
jgi:hypothetical protein